MLKSTSFLILSCLIISLSGCAAIFAPQGKPPPDPKKISRGMDRAEVEQVLGAPILDIRPANEPGVSRQCEYRYTVRESISPNASYMQVLTNKMLGFEERSVTVFYDLKGRVQRIENQAVRKPARQGI